MRDESLSEAWVKLTTGEMHIAATVGYLRQIENLMKCRRDAHGAEPDKGWSIHIEGAAGEMAFAKWAGKYWSGNLGDLKADDVGRFQVRTRAKHDWRLILHPSDPDDRIFIAVTGLAPSSANARSIGAIRAARTGMPSSCRTRRCNR